MLSNYATNFALIDRERNTVTNIIWGNIYQDAEFNTDTQLAVVIEDLSVQIGDTYDGEHFYHNGERVISAADMIADMQTALEMLEVRIDG